MGWTEARRERRQSSSASHTGDGSRLSEDALTATASGEATAGGTWRSVARFATTYPGRAAALSSAVSAATTVARLSALILVLLGVAVVSVGVSYLGRALVHRSDPDYQRHQDTRSLVREEVGFARRWIPTGVLLAAAGALLPAVAVAGAGAVAALVIYVRTLRLGGKAARYEKRLTLQGGSARIASTRRVRGWNADAAAAPTSPGTTTFRRIWGRKRPRGEISAFLASALLAMALIGAGYGGVLVAHAVEAIVERGTNDDGQRHRQGRAPAATERRQRPPRRYADLCPQLPDPLAIGHGLGLLFQHDGAVEAGCGTEALEFDRGVWVSRGICGKRLRSVALAVPRRSAVILYGEAAVFAYAAAVSGVLLHAERALPRDGDVSLITTTEGTYVFARARPSVGPRRGEARQCGEIDETARPFTVLRPQLAGLWYEHVRRYGWAWPEKSGAGRIRFVDPRTGGVVAEGRCGGGGCELTSDLHAKWTLHGPASVPLAVLERATHATP